VLYNFIIIFSAAIMDLPGNIDSYARVVIAGVESEEVEEVNDAYKDMLEDIGNSRISTITEAGY
jgi:hypothetical protein